MDYQPLNDSDNEIRLLTIKPADDEAAAVDCTLAHFSLSMLPSYAALSYCWGNPDDTQPITINGSTFDATVNLYHALVSFRSKGVDRLWVDAICIDQKNLEEKGKQISLMGSIYRQARQVLAWTGPEDDESAEILNIVKRYSQQASRATGAHQAGDHSLVPLDNFLGRDYWTRVWIIQEIVLAQSLVLHIGPHTMEWATLATAVIRILQAPQKITADKLSLYNMLENLIRLRREITENPSGKLIPLARALRRSWMAKATEPRDKIFAMLGLAEDRQDYVVAPTYRGSIDELCERIMLQYIAVKRDMTQIALLGRGCDNMSDGRPSWCPEFHNLDGNVLDRQLSILSIGEPIVGFQSRLFRARFAAAGGTQALPVYRDGALVCSATFAGGIAKLGRSITDESTVVPPAAAAEPAEPAEPPAASAAAASLPTTIPPSAAQPSTAPTSAALPTTGPNAQSAGKSKGRLRNPYPSKSTLFRAIYDTLLCGSDTLDGFWMEQRAYYMSEILRIWRSDYHAGFDEKTQAWIDEHRSFVLHGRTIQDWCRWKTWTPKGMGYRNTSVARRQDILFANVRHYIVPDLTRVIGTGMRWVVTTNGFFGWVPGNARVGDVLYVFKGCNVPVLLRPREQGGFVLVGDAYISSMMDGRVTKPHGRYVPQWREVELY